MRFEKVLLMSAGMFIAYSGSAADVKKTASVSRKKPVVNKTIAKVDYKTVLNKYAEAFSKMDEKAIASMTDKITLGKIKAELKQVKKKGKPVNLTVSYQHQRKLAQGKVAVEALDSLKVNGSYLYRNGFTQYIFANNKIVDIRKLFRPDNVILFWDAVMHADAFGIMESANRGRELKITGLLSGEKFNGNIKFPRWVLYQVRKPGQYLLPLKRTTAGYKIMGRYYRIPAFKTNEAKKFSELFRMYKTLKPAEEKTFLKKQIADDVISSLGIANLVRLTALGEFKYPLSKQEMAFWAKVFAKKDLPLSFRHHLIAVLTRSNFQSNSPVFIAALKDPKFTFMVGRFYYRHDRTGFEKMMIDWLKDDKLRQCALQNSEYMVSNLSYVNEAMKYFDPKDKKNLRYFIPILCATSDAKGEKFIKNILVNEKDPKNFAVYFMTVREISRTRPTRYTEELKIFLKNHKNNRFVKDGIIYPTILSCLCRARDIDGLKQTLAYIETLKHGSSTSRREKMKLNIFLRSFHSYNPRLSTLDQFQKDLQKQLAKLEKAKKSIAAKNKKK